MQKIHCKIFKEKNENYILFYHKNNDKLEYLFAQKGDPKILEYFSKDRSLRKILKERKEFLSKTIELLVIFTKKYNLDLSKRESNLLRKKEKEMFKETYKKVLMKGRTCQCF